MGQKIINPSICRLPISTQVLCDPTGVLHFQREKIRLCDLVAKSRVVRETYHPQQVLPGQHLDRQRSHHYAHIPTADDNVERLALLARGRCQRSLADEYRAPSQSRANARFARSDRIQQLLCEAYPWRIRWHGSFTSKRKPRRGVRDGFLCFGRYAFGAGYKTRR